MDSSNRPKIVGLIPARAGSKRITNKNIRTFQGHPLLAHSIQSALDSECFSRVLVSTDSHKIAEIARYYGADAPFSRPAEYAADSSPDIEWVTHALEMLKAMGESYDAFAILRPTNPFRSANTIRRAVRQFEASDGIHSLRAVQAVSEHPYKMWVIESDSVMTPLMGEAEDEVPYHSRPYQSLPKVYVQNASLEIAWTWVVKEYGSISGRKIAPFVSEGYEGHDINSHLDWIAAESLARGPDVVSTQIHRLPSPSIIEGQESL